MARVLFLLFILIFLSSVAFWAEDQFMETQVLEEIVESNEGDDIGNEPSFEQVVVSEEVQDFEYGFFAGSSELRVYDGLEIDELEVIMDQGYDVLVLLDGSILDQSRYNFNTLKMIKVEDYDGEFFYASKFGMKVGDAFMFSRRDFRRSYESAGEQVMVFILD